MPSAGGPDVLPRIDRADAGGAGGSLPVLWLVDEKAANTSGGTFTQDDWRTRTLNTEKVDEIGSTLSSNQFTLPAGTYNIIASAPAHAVNRHQARLRNITDGVTVVLGSSEYGNTGVDADAGRSWVQGRFTIAATKTFELQHRCQTTTATRGFGVECNFDEVEIYASVWIVKVA